MHRRFILLCLCTILPLTISLRTSAHSGRTDANGGHTDHSTGEYHYHHGYSAHDHCDMDGDGDLDCPYEYNAQTKYENDDYVSHGISTQYTNNTQPSNVSLPNNALNAEATKKEDNSFRWPFWVIGMLLASLIVLFVLLKNKCRKFQELKISHEKEIQRITNRLIVLDEDLYKRFGYNYLCILTNAPIGDTLDEQYLPKSPTYNKDWGNYTVYVQHPYLRGAVKKYHTASCRYAAGATPINVFEVHASPNNYQPCKLCNPKLLDVSWVIKAREYIEFFKKYVPSSNIARAVDTELSKGTENNPLFGQTVCIADLEKYSNDLGVPVDTAKILLNSERKEKGIPPFMLVEASAEQICASKELDIIASKKMHLSPLCTKVSNDYIFEAALEMGVSAIIALKILNQERTTIGLPPLNNSEEEVSG